MKFLYKWLGIYQLEDKIARLKQMNRDDLETITELSTKYNNLLEIKNLVELERDSYQKELNTTLSSKSTLTAEVLKLREQLEEANKEIKQLKELNEAQTNKIVDIKYTIKNRLLNLLQHDLSISIRPEEYYD